MTKQKLQKFETRLTTERQAIIDQIHDQEEDGGCGDTDLEVLEKLTDSEARLIKKIDLALIRIEDESYGICTSCEEEISLERLEAKPSVSLCRDCQTEHESKT